jgi:hypothetical protein
MNALEVIGRKRDGREHNAEEIEFLLSGYLRKEIPRQVREIRNRGRRTVASHGARGQDALRAA